MCVLLTGVLLLLSELTTDPKSKNEALSLDKRAVVHGESHRLLLAHLLRADNDWRSARITLASVVDSAEAADSMVTQVREGLSHTRIQANVEAVVCDSDRGVVELIHERSRDCDLVFLGLPLVPAGEEDEAARRLLELVEGMPSTILVRSAGPFRGQLV